MASRIEAALGYQEIILKIKMKQITGGMGYTLFSEMFKLI